jgi:hypothetical protein
MIDRNCIYDERPGFESYSMMNFPYPSMPIMQGQYYQPNSNNNLEDKISKLENKINSLENRISRIEGSMSTNMDYSNIYPKATYQNSLSMM